ncbi:uncharacterized protein BDR25DRAFT_338299 [Lindgomyces ingoldianus]|uniref:Uncharacterized protein n=1 Tax=Lindgomyces ingoldianus TaxID=673940 RepID=A0ACB6RE17_9PLEO|nr:uncharacterized protein BDR25DRAFT_338299 [Lindgomyces ingoldianus]KAF2477436.1 hypothetical protein BDR25DRAFT_338299 [Lindgomyces ingoldianus]
MSSSFANTTNRHRGTISQPALVELANDIDIGSYPLRARFKLLVSALLAWKITCKRLRNLNGLKGRLGADCALKPGFEGVRKREVASPRDSAGVRKIGKQVKVIGEGEGEKRTRGVFGGERERKWVLLGKGEGSRLRVAVDGVGGIGVREEGVERMKGALRRETEFWGKYKVVRGGVEILR